MSRHSLLKTVLSLLAPIVFIGSANAHWSLDNAASTLSFVTVKAEHVAEVHTFDVLSGSIDDAGEVKIAIELASVNTMIQIRNERMQAMLFETNLFPDATITGKVDLEAITAMNPGASEVMQIEIELSLHGASIALTAELMVTRLESGVMASTLKPIIVTADSVGLVAGIEALREVAGLPSISRSVPVSFTLVFKQGQ
ncbi:MAG: YceI family protein [Proteobacteria bacterium]|nr:YceI family protein [Pseudomonadota bacterium]